MLKDRTYYSTLARIALPIIAQNFVTSSLNVIDIAMIGQLGETLVASVGLANQIFFLLMLTLFGTYSGVGVFTSQFWGKGDLKSVRKVLGIGLVIGVAASLVFTFFALGIPKVVLGFYSEDQAVLNAGSGYLRIVGFSYTITAVTFAFNSVLRSTGHVRVPMAISIFALSLKTLLNYGLILGNLGMPAMGIEGAALSTVVARLIECAAVITVVYWRRLPPAARLSEMFGFSRSFLKTVLTTSLPVLLNEMLWSLGITTYNMVYGRIGTEAMASISIASSIENLAFVIFVGISDACGIMVGNRIGANEEHKAYLYARQTLIIGTIGAVIIGAVILVGSDTILAYYKLSEAAILNAHNILRVMGFALWVRVTNMILIVGILRAGGDTRFGLILDSGTVWLVGVPLAVIGGLVLHLPVYVVYLLVICEEVAKYGVAMWRFLSRRWIRNLVQAV